MKDYLWMKFGLEGSVILIIKPCYKFNNELALAVAPNCQKDKWKTKA